MSVYLFALAEATAAGALSQGMESLETGRDLSQVRILDLGALSAIVSTVLAEEVRPNRRTLMAHMRALEAAQDLAEILPVQFGQVFADDQALVDSIAPKSSKIRAEIARLAGKSEFAVRVSTEHSRIIASLATTYPDLKARYAAAAAKGAAGHYDRVDLGRQVEEHMGAWRSGAQTQILDALNQVAATSHVEPVSDDNEIFRGDFLVAQSDLDEFEAALANVLPRIAHVEPDDITARIVGPAPPSRFVEIDLAQSNAMPFGSAA